MNEILKQPRTRGMIWMVSIMAVLVILLTVGLYPISTLPLPQVEPFFPMYATAVILIEGLTAYFLAIQYHFTAKTFLAALSGAYGFVVVMVLFQLMVFPGAFSTSGLFNVGHQEAPWIWVVWHGGFPLLVLFALSLYPRQASDQTAERRPSLPGALGMGLILGQPVFALVVALGLLALGGMLPALIEGDSYSLIVDSMLTPAVLALNVLALLACLVITRLRDLLSLWLGLALLAGLGDTVLTLSAVARYSVGWYAARAMSLASSSMVLGFLIWEISGLYRQLLRSHRQLESRMAYDGLTSAFNRGYFTDCLKQEVIRARQNEAPLSLLMIDADYFKGYNDHLGHQKGDSCLVAIVAAIRRGVRRADDCVARYGGEEFVVVLPRANTEIACMIAEAIHRQIALEKISRYDGVSPYVTVSIGVATLEAGGGSSMDHEELIRRADHALYQAKHAGRNTSAVYDGG